MKLKKTTSILLAASLCFPMLLSACGPAEGDKEKVVSSVKIVLSETTYTVGDTFDYAEVGLSVTYSDKSVTTLNLESEGVTHNTLDMNTAGKQTLTATYEKKSDSVDITIVKPQEGPVYIFSLDAPQTYTTMQREDDPNGTKSANRTLFMKGIEAYEVGADNGFVFKPDAYAYDPEEDDVLPLADPETVFDLYVRGEDGQYPADPEAEPETYVTTKEGQNNVYYFTADAVGKTVKLVVRPGEKYDTALVEDEADITFEAELLIVDGYNVYNQLGLSVLDNVNVNHWKEIKEAAGTLAWDTKPLVEYKEVATVVLHNDIDINADGLPSYYFWDEARTDQGFNFVKTELGKGETAELGYAELLQGSLRDYSPTQSSNDYFLNDPSDGEYAEHNSVAYNVQKGFYSTTGTSISGNGMQLGYSNSETRNLFTVYDSTWKGNASPTSHWALIKFEETVNTMEGETPFTFYNNEVSVKNLRIVGQMGRRGEDDDLGDGEPAQPMGITARSDALTIENCNFQQMYVHIMSDDIEYRFIGKDSDRSDDGAYDTPGVVNNIVNCKLYDAYSNMVYGWRSTFNVTNSILKEAGGPLFLLCDGGLQYDTHYAFGNQNGKQDDANDELGPHLNVDEASVLEAYAAGSEPWFTVYKAGALVQLITNMLAPLAQRDLKLNCLHTFPETGSVQQINLIAALLPEPGDIMKSFDTATSYPQTSGYITRGNEKYAMNDFLGNAQLNTALAQAKAGYSILFQSGSLVGYMPNATSIATAYPGAASDWLMIYMNTNTQGFKNPPYFGVLLGDVVSM